LLLEGTWMTIKLSALSLAVSVLLGLLGASAKLSSLPLLRIPAQLYTTLIRGVPDLVLMLLIFYSLQTWLTGLTDFMEWEYIEIDPFSAGVITLGFIYGAYFTETFRGAILAVPAARWKPPPPTASNAASGFARGVPADDALCPAGHWQQLDGDAQGHRAGVDHRPGGSGQGRPGCR
jgi:His/Glu/Gln/Arg/opine family amino acid ABC transporter permease subunit